jgi:hypothetical protein
MDLIVEMRFGSHLYGTATLRSDIDVKGVYLPSGHDILLQRVQGNVTRIRGKAPGEKNAPGDTDFEAYSLQRYLELLAAGQTVALDMLFAPDAVMLREPAPLWREIQAAAPRLISRQAGAFLRYCRRQANAFGIKGLRVAAARQALAVLEAAETELGSTAALAQAEQRLAPILTPPHVGVVDMEMPGGRLVRHLEVCGKRMPFTGTIKTACGTVRKLVNAYGERARQAELNEGVDWKALSHAVRVGREALDLFRTGRIVFPLPYAEHLLAIKQGERPYEEVASEIERLLAEVEDAAKTSGLPEAADTKFIDELVARAYWRKIQDET